jgi:hypothetical protein
MFIDMASGFNKYGGVCNYAVNNNTRQSWFARVISTARNKARQMLKLVANIRTAFGLYLICASSVASKYLPAYQSKLMNQLESQWITTSREKLHW